MYIWYIVHFSCQAVGRVFYPRYTYIVTQHTPVDTFQITMPGTPTSSPPRRSPQSKTKASSSTTTTSNDSESDADERPPRTPPPQRSPRSKKSARTSENSESDADEQTPTSPRPPRRASRGKKKARTTCNTSDHSEIDPADGPGKKKKTYYNQGQHAKTPAAAGRKKFANYSEDDDYLIAMAFVHVTVDPIRGVGQKSETFWTQVHEKFCLLQQKELAVIGFDIIVRTRDSIEQG
jgi:DNA mismatch repair ATPase MutL